MKRIFIVGIARSGTTLLQSLVGSHPRIATFPESHLFLYTIPKEKLLRRIHRINKGHAASVRAFLESIQKAHIYRPYAGRAFNLDAWTRYLLSTFDRIAEEDGKDCWLEKTPMHLHYIGLIEKNSPGCLFLHVIREPIANIAALVHVGNAYPETFSQDTVSKALARYKKEIKLSERHWGKPNHQFIRYKAMLTDPEAVSRKVCEGLGLSFHVKMLDYLDTATRITQSDEDWKSKNTQVIKKEDKVAERLTKEERAFLKVEVSRIRSRLLADDA